jgi:mannitol 2-dehydrogenase
MIHKLAPDEGVAPAATLSRPKYDRSKLTPGIVHVGVGNFHRAHQAHYLHRLFDTGRDHDWAIVGAGIKPFDASMRERLEQQDWQTTVMELDPAGFSATVVGSMIDFAAIDPQAIIDTMSRSEIRIVSLTVTEGGYYIDAKTGSFDNNHPEIVADAGNPKTPSTVFGIIIAALQKRREAGLPPFTVMSCDNLPGNGHVTRTTVMGLARQMGGDIADFIEANVAFPNGMVDCITPATGPREIKLVNETFNVDDKAPVVCEPFRQWVLEDDFPQGRPALEDVGVEFVEDVAPYELMKLRILNGGHAVIAYSSALLGHTYAHEGMADPLVTGFLEKLEFSEMIPTVPEIPGVSLTDYYRKIAERFANAELGDTIARLCLDGSNRQPKFILPTIADRLKAGQGIEGLALESALWCRYCTGISEDAGTYKVDDVLGERLRATALEAKFHPDAWLAMHDIYGSLGSNDTFRKAFAAALNAVWANGTRATLEAYLEA